VNDRPEAVWRGPLANHELTPELLPAPEAPWSGLVHFAGTLNGYEVTGESPGELLAFANPIAERWRASRELPSDLTALRVALFAEQRRDHFSDSASDPLTLRYIHALVEAIRAQVVATGEDPPA
jgi:hypothetical protein